MEYQDTCTSTMYIYGGIGHDSHLAMTFIIAPSVVDVVNCLLVEFSVIVQTQGRKEQRGIQITELL